MNYIKVRPYITEVAEVSAVGLLPLDNEACTYLSYAQDATPILDLVVAAAKAAQVIEPRFGITAPAPNLLLMSGKQPSGNIGANDQMDLINGSTTIAYIAKGVPRAYCIRGTVVIPNPSAPNDAPLRILNIEAYVGRLIAQITGPVTTLFMDGTTGEFFWR